MVLAKMWYSPLGSLFCLCNVVCEEILMPLSSRNNGIKVDGWCNYGNNRYIESLSCNEWWLGDVSH